MTRHVPDLPVSGQANPDEVRLDLGAREGRLDLVVEFGNENPVELEIGVGKGRFLLLAASAQQETNFLGLEYIRGYFERSLGRIAKRNLKNVRLVHAEAFAFLRDRLHDASLAGCHIYFPDPWPKKRHHKRRIVRPAVLDELARVLEPEALVRVVSDHADYALLIRETLGADARFVDVEPRTEHWELPAMNELTAPGVTNFEIKYRREGRPIHRFVFRRAPGS